MIALIAVGLAGCPTEPIGGGSDPPPLVSITPAEPTTADALTVAVEPPADAGFSWENWAIAWQRDGGQVLSVDGVETVPASETARDQAWTVTLTSLQTGEVATSPAITIVNTPPAMTFANLDPAEPRSDEAIVALVGGWTDPDGDAETYRFDWLVDGMDIGAPDAQTLAPGSYTAGQQVSVVVTPTDGLDDGQPMTAAAVTVINGQPNAPTVSILPTKATDNDDLVCVIDTASDPDMDVLSFSFSWTVGGVNYPAAVPGAIGPATTTEADDTVPAQDTEANQNWVCSVVANDGAFDSDAGTASAYLSAEPVIDFGLEDVNATSPRFGEVVSPRDYLQKVSGWYFGHST